MNYNFEDDNKTRKKIKKIILKIFLWIIEIFSVIFLAYFIVNYTIEKTVVNTNSMENTLFNNDSIIIDKFIYKIRKPKRFEVIVFKDSTKHQSYYNIKRIIGLPNETIQIKDNNIYINNEIIKEKIIVDNMINYGLANEEITLDEDEYFVLGDNRNNSEDSRFASLGNVVKNDIIGMARIRLSPFNFISKLNNIIENERKD